MPSLQEAFVRSKNQESLKPSLGGKETLKEWLFKGKELILFCGWLQHPAAFPQPLKVLKKAWESLPAEEQQLVRRDKRQFGLSPDPTTRGAPRPPSSRKTWARGRLPEEATGNGLHLTVSPPPPLRGRSFWLPTQGWPAPPLAPRQIRCPDSSSSTTSHPAATTVAAHEFRARIGGLALGLHALTSARAGDQHHLPVEPQRWGHESCLQRQTDTRTSRTSGA